jgi:hypothetical protein
MTDDTSTTDTEQQIAVILSPNEYGQEVPKEAFYDREGAESTISDYNGRGRIVDIPIRSVETGT